MATPLEHRPAPTPIAERVGETLTRLARVTGELATADSLLAFTDGLVERRDEDIDTGLQRLARAVPHLGGPSLATGVNLVVEAVRDETYDDDMAALGLRRLA